MAISQTWNYGDSGSFPGHLGRSAGSAGDLMEGQFCTRIRKMGKSKRQAGDDEPRAFVRVRSQSITPAMLKAGAEIIADRMDLEFGRYSAEILAEAVFEAMDSVRLKDDTNNL